MVWVRYIVQYIYSFFLSASMWRCHRAEVQSGPVSSGEFNLNFPHCGKSESLTSARLVIDVFIRTDISYLFPFLSAERSLGQSANATFNNVCHNFMHSHKYFLSLLKAWDIYWCSIYFNYVCQHRPPVYISTFINFSVQARLFHTPLNQKHSTRRITFYPHEPPTSLTSAQFSYSEMIYDTKRGQRLPKMDLLDLLLLL